MTIPPVKPSEPPPSRGRWIGAIAFLAVALAFAGTAIWWTQRTTQGTAAPAPSPSASPAPENTVQPADGCLGGPNPEKAALIAQQQAPLTGDGAAAFLASYYRWHSHMPKSPGWQAVTPQLWAPDVDAAQNPFETEANLADEGLSGGDARFLSSHYEVLEISENHALISMSFDFVDPQGQVVSRAAAVFRAVVVDGHWRFGGLDLNRTRDEAGPVSDHGVAYRTRLARDGIPFQGGC